MDRVLCGANAQSMKYYLNEAEFHRLPQAVKEELKVICVGYCADVGGVITLSFDGQNRLHVQTISPIDEIGAELLVRRIQREHAELFRQLEEFAAAFPGGQS